jgi:hypothetical protein
MVTEAGVKMALAKKSHTYNMTYLKTEYTGNFKKEMERREQLKIKKQ